MSDSGFKVCSICGTSFPLDEFTYGNRDNRSYCKTCDKAEKAAYAQGGTEAAKRFRDERRKHWRSEP